METPPIMNYSEPQLTGFERRVLRRYLKLREKPPTLWRLMLLRWWFYLVLLIWGVAGSAWLFHLDVPNWAMLVLGLMVGATFRDLPHYRLAVKAWPLLERVLDWERIKQLLGVAG